MIDKIDFFKVSNKAMKNLINMETFFHEESTINPIVRELIKIRASQINGCAYCLNMHTVDALKIGETNQRIFMISAWWETNIFTKEEKAVLNLTEHLTNVSTKGAPENVVEEVLKYYTKKEFTELVLMITQINTWNRINIAVHNDLDENYQ